MEFKNISTPDDFENGLVRWEVSEAYMIPELTPYEIRELMEKMGINGIVHLTGQKKETCPNCGREHYGESVRVYGENQRLHWHGCLVCWKRLTLAMPIAFEMAEAIQTLTFIEPDRGRLKEILDRWVNATSES